MGNASVKSMYVHIPFCRRICSYCDFCKNFYNEELASKYLDALESEIKSTYKNNVINTLYIGGGTPSALSLNNLKKLFKILKSIKLSNKYEFTFECNYEDITDQLLSILQENKVNRLSVGIQTFNSSYEKILNRIINKEKIIESINIAKKYFHNINVDLMYALPNEKLDDLKHDLDMFISLNVSHISTYALIIEDGTLLKIENTKEIDDELQSDMYYYIKNYLEKNGYLHYEISNYSKKGFESKHNLTYWNNMNYYGFGAGASSFVGNKRIDNTKSIYNYMNKNKIMHEEILDNNQLIKDEVMLNLRKINGINKKEFYSKYKKTVDNYFLYNELINNSLLIEDNENIKINEKYLFVSNSIISKFIDMYKY